MVNAFKFREHCWMRTDFVDFLEAVTRSRFHIGKIDAVLAVPIPLRRRFDRGYNQSECLARLLAKRLERRFVDGAMKRLGSPRRQGALKEEERRTNVIGTFAVRCAQELVGRTVLVVDDIMTTGSTLSECARVLKVAGVKRVWCVTLARSFRN